MKQIILATPRGFCAGVDRAIAIVEKALEKFGAPIYVRHEVVHNKTVIDDLVKKGAIFVEALDDIPSGATVIFSAHGVSQAVREEAEKRDFTIFDATCPLVTKVHMEVRRLHTQGFEIIMIGHKNHPEVEGTMGQAPTGMHLVKNISDVEKLEVKTPQKLAWVTQTTLSVDDTAVIVQALEARFPGIMGPPKDDICYATQNRQNAVKQLADTVDMVIVVGSQSSSNSNRLREVAASRGIPAYMVDNESEINPKWLEGHPRIGITSGASAPEILVQRVIEKIRGEGIEKVLCMPGIEEHVIFTLPKGLD